MNHIATTPFGRRPVTAGLLAAQQLADMAPPLAEVNTYTLLDDLRDARAAFGITDRDLAVLAALISFRPGRTLSDDGALVGYPSNRALAARAHGMAESTLRRHLAALVQSGLILRHDSPNGKRYAARGRDGALACAYGFSLRPLLVRATQIADTAEAARNAAHAQRQMRAEVTVALRDAVKLLAYASEHHADRDRSTLEATATDLRKILRRKLDADALATLHRSAMELVTAVKRSLETSLQTQEMSGNDAEIERHHQNSNTDSSDLELRLENSEVAEVESGSPQVSPTVPLALVTKACPDLALFADAEIGRWTHLVHAADKVRPMIGISADAWHQACAVMGHDQAATTVAAILQRAAHINNPGGYLRALTRRAEQAAFSPGPMIMALLKAA